MKLFGNFFKKRKSLKKEIHSDEQYLDALEIIKESMQTYLELLVQANQAGDVEMAKRLEQKLNSNFEFYNKSRNGELKIIHTATSTCHFALNSDLLKINQKKLE